MTLRSMRSFHVKSGASGWLENNLDINVADHVKCNVDVDGLTSTMRHIIGHVLANSKAIERAKNENEKLHRLLDEEKKNAYSLELRCKALDDEIAKLRMEIMILGENKEGKLAIDDVKSRHQMEFTALREELRRLDTAKMERNSPQLEADARKYSLETVKSFFTTRNKELRSWVEKKLTTLQTLLQREASDQNEAITKAFDVTCEEIQEQVTNTKQGLSKIIKEQGLIVDKTSNTQVAMCNRLLGMEEEGDVTQQELQNDILKLQHEIRLLYSVLSTSYAELEKHSSHAWKHLSAADVEYSNEKDSRIITRLEERSRQWKNVQCSIAAEVLWEANEFEIRSKVNALRMKADEHELLLETARAKAEQPDPLPEALVAYMHTGRIFTEFRTLTDSLVNKIINYCIEDMKDDMTQEAQNVARDLKTKITSQRCIELIQDQIVGAFNTEKEITKQRLDLLEQTKIGITQVNEMLKVKADVSAIQLKADRAIMLEMFEFVNSKIGVESSDDAVKRAVRQINTKLEDLQNQKLDKNCHEMQTLASLISGNTNFPTQNITASFSSTRPTSGNRRKDSGPNSTGRTEATCLSCHSTSPEVHPLEDVVSKREREKQESQDQLHLRQMASAAAKEIQQKREQRRLSAPIDVNSYITNLAKPLIPAPPALSAQGVDPRMIP